MGKGQWERIHPGAEYVKQSSFLVTVAALPLAWSCTPASVQSPSGEPAPCVNPGIYVQNNTAQRAEIRQFKPQEEKFVSYVLPLRRVTIALKDTSPAHYAAYNEYGRYLSRSEVMIERVCSDISQPPS